LCRGSGIVVVLNDLPIEEVECPYCDGTGEVASPPPPEASEEVP